MYKQPRTVVVLAAEEYLALSVSRLRVGECIMDLSLKHINEEIHDLG